MIGPMQSTVVQASGLIKTGPGVIYGLILSGGADAATVILYDNTAGSGTKAIGLVKAAINSTVHVSFPGGIAFGAGCYATITGTTPDVTVIFS